MKKELQADVCDDVEELRNTKGGKAEKGNLFWVSRAVV